MIRLVVSGVPAFIQVCSLANEPVCVNNPPFTTGLPVFPDMVILIFHFSFLEAIHGDQKSLIPLLPSWPYQNH